MTSHDVFVGEKIDGVLGEILAGVLLQDVTRVVDGRVFDARRAAHLALEQCRHRAGDRIAVTSPVGAG